jgi:hypothetical protein
MDERVPSAVIYSKTYKQNRDYYGEPWWLPAVPDAEVWAKVPVFNRTQIDTGFKPTVHLHTYISADTKDLDQYDKDIEDAYTGANGRGIFHTFGTQDENAPVLNVLERGDHAGELDAIREAAEAVVVRGYGVPDLLYRMDVVGGLTSAGNAMKAAADQFMEGFVKPKQQMITKDLVRLMNAEGINVWNAEIIELQLFDDASEAEAVRLRTMTIDELRDDMDLPALDDERGNIIPGLISQPMRDDLGKVPVDTPTTPTTDGLL